MQAWRRDATHQTVEHRFRSKIPQPAQQGGLQIERLGQFHQLQDIGKLDGTLGIFEPKDRLQVAGLPFEQLKIQNRDADGTAQAVVAFALVQLLEVKTAHIVEATRNVEFLGLNLQFNVVVLAFFVNSLDVQNGGFVGREFLEIGGIENCDLHNAIQAAQIEDRVHDSFTLAGSANTMLNSTSLSMRSSDTTLAQQDYRGRSRRS